MQYIKVKAHLNHLHKHCKFEALLSFQSVSYQVASISRLWNVMCLKWDFGGRVRFYRILLVPDYPPPPLIPVGTK